MIEMTYAEELQQRLEKYLNQGLSFSDAWAKVIDSMENDLSPNEDD